MGERPEGKGEERKFADVPKFDGKSDWKAFYAKFSRYAEVSEWPASPPSEEGAHK
jgi:hypothetical protein